MILQLIDFVHKTFGIGKDTTATILVTLITFSAGILITITFKAIEGYLDRRNHRKLARLNLINLMKEIFHQATSYKKFAEEIKIETTTPAFKQISISSTDIFYQLGYKNLYNAFFNGIENIHFKSRNKKRIAFNRLWSALEFLTVFHQKSFKDVKEFIELEKAANYLRNKSIGETFKIISTIRFTFHRETIAQNLASYCLALEDILKNQQKEDDNTNPKVVNDYLILPISELNNKHFDVLKEYMNILNPTSFNSLLSDCTFNYENQKNLTESYRKYFNHLNESFISTFENLKFTYRTFF
jgi:hypothetical protein